MPATNLFAYNAQTPIGPAIKTLAITKSDADELAFVTRRIFVGTGGDVVTVDTENNEVTHKNVPSGSYIGDAFFKKVKSTGTTAADLIAYV